MKKILADRTAVKKKSEGPFPWNYNAPTKDQAHSGELCCGDNYGSAKAQPVGKFKASGPDAGPVPQSSKCFSPEEIFNHEDRRG